MNDHSAARQGPAAILVVVMGVAGAGKSLVGRSLAQRLGWRFIDADDLHPETNIEKMSAGIPLTDADRKPWLDAIVALILRVGEPVVLACSSLRRQFRRELQERVTSVQFVWLRGDEALFRRRLSERPGHFFAPELLSSQFEALEEPDGALVIDASHDVAAIVEEITRSLQLG
jgi:gluconokinase